MIQYPNLFIGTPTHVCKRYCAHEFMEATITNAPGTEFHVLCNSRDGLPIYSTFPGAVYHHFGSFLDASHFHCVDSVHKRIAATCNELRSRFLDSKCDLYLSLESDVMLAPDALPRMVAAISDEFPVVYANCYRWPNGLPFLEYETPQRTGQITMGCTLIRRDVLEKIEFRYDPNLLAAFHDAHFAFDCNKLGIGMWYDPTIHLRHVEGGTGRRGWGEIPQDELPRTRRKAK